MDAPSVALSLGDSRDLKMMKMEREVRGLVRNALKGSHVHPVAINFGLAHPILAWLNFGHNGHYHLTLALRAKEKLSEDRLVAVDRNLLDWGQKQIPMITVDPVKTKIAGWRDKVNGFVQSHGNGGEL